MIILAVDTSGIGCSVAVANDHELIADFNLRKNETHSKHLMGIIEDLLRISGIGVPDIESFAVAHGPGSFTGLRIGLSTVKGLAMSVGKPVVGISSLDALAHGVSLVERRNLCVMIDARKNEVFTAGYTLDNGQLKKTTSEHLVGVDDLGRAVQDDTFFVGSGSVRYRDIIAQRMGHRAFFAPESFHHIQAAIVADLGFEMMKRRRMEDIDNITPCYIRKSDAEIHKEIHGS